MRNRLKVDGKLSFKRVFLYTFATQFVGFIFIFFMITIDKFIELEDKSILTFSETLLRVHNKLTFIFIAVGIFFTMIGSFFLYLMFKNSNKFK